MWNYNSNTDWCGGYFDPFIVDLNDGMQNNTSIYPWLCFSDGEEVIVVDFFEVPISKEGILEAVRQGSFLTVGGLL